MQVQGTWREMEAKELEVKHFYFRQRRKINIGDPGVSPTLRYSLLCVSNEFGLTFVGCNNGVYMFETAILYPVDRDEGIGPQNVMADVSCLKATHIPTPSPPQHIAISCDNLTLSVCLKEGPFLKCLFYDTRSLKGKGSPLTPFCSIALTTEQGVHLCGLRWSPTNPELLAICLSNGVLQLLTVTNDVSVTCKKTDLHANTICWSPKGKQLAVGLRDGMVLQLSPKNFELKKSYPCPLNGEPHQVSDLHWISSHMFAVIYTPRSQDDAPSFVFIIAAKNAAPVFVNYQDVFYGNGTKMNKFYFSYISKWNVLMASSANAVESAVFGQDGEGETGQWAKWELEDTGRAEMPLDDNNENTFVAGAALDFTSTEEVTLRDTLMFPPSPLLLLYSDRGILCPFTVVNVGSSLEAIKLLVSPPKPLPAAPIRQPVQPQGGLMQQQFQEESVKQVQLSGSSGPFSSLQIGQGLLAPLPTPSQTTSGLSALTSSGSSPFTELNLGGNRLGSTAFGQPSFPFSVSSITGATSEASQQDQGKSSTAFPSSQPTTSSLPTGLPSQPPTSQAGSLQTEQFFTGLLSKKPSTEQFFTGLLTQKTAGGPPTTPSTPQVHPPTLQKLLSTPSSSQPLQPPKHLPTLGDPSSRIPTYPLSPAMPVIQPNPPQGTPPIASGPQRMGTQLPSQAPLPGPRPAGQQPPPNVVLPQGVQLVPQAILNQSVQPGMPPLHSSTPILPGYGPQPHPGSKPVGSAQPQPPPVAQLLTARPSVTPRTVPVPTPATATISKPPPKPNPTTAQPQRLPAGQTPPARTHPASGAASRRDDHQSADAEKIEATFSANIQDEIDKFADELESLKDDMREVFGEWEGRRSEDMKVEGLGSMQDMQELREEAQETQQAIEEIVMTMKDLENKSGQLGDEILRGCELSEGARAKMKKKDDPNYTALLKLRPLDAYNQRRLDDIRSTFLQTEHSLNEVNSQLDAEMERRNEARRQSDRSPLRAPSIQTIYSTLRNNRKIVRMQNANIGQVAREMKKLKLIPQSWHPSDAIALQSPPAATRDITSTPALGTSTWLPEEEVAKQRVYMAPEKLEQLKDHLSNIKKTPVRRVELTRYKFPSLQASISQSGAITPSQSSQFSGRETPLSSNPEGPASYIDSDVASTAEDSLHIPDLQSLPLHAQYSGRSASFPTGLLTQNSLQPLPSHGLLANRTTSLPMDSLRQDPLRPPPPQLHHYPVQLAPLASNVTKVPQGFTPSGVLNSQLSTSSLQSQPDVIVGADSQMKVRTPEGYKVTTLFAVQSSTGNVTRATSITHPHTENWGAPPLTSVEQSPSSYNPASTPLAVQSSTGSVTRATSITHPHTVNWGAPPLTSVEQSPQVTGTPALQLLGSLPGVTGELKRSNPLSDLTKIQSPLAVSTTASKATPSVALTAGIPAATSQTTSPFNWAPTFSLSLSGNPAMTIKPTSDFSDVLLGIKNPQKPFPSKTVPSQQTATPATTSENIFSGLPSLKGSISFTTPTSGPRPLPFRPPPPSPFSFTLGNVLSSTTTSSSSLTTTTTTSTSSGFVFGSLSTLSVGSLSSVPPLRLSGPLTAPHKEEKDEQNDEESLSPCDSEKGSDEPGEETTSSSLATGGGPIPQGLTMLKPTDTTGGLFDTASSKSILGISKPNATVFQKPSDVRAEEKESNGGQQTETEPTGVTTVKAVTEAASSTKSDPIQPPHDDQEIDLEIPTSTYTSSATALPSALDSIPAPVTSIFDTTSTTVTTVAPTTAVSSDIQLTQSQESSEQPQPSVPLVQPPSSITQTITSTPIASSEAASTQATTVGITGVPQLPSTIAATITVSEAGVLQPQTSIAATTLAATAGITGVPQPQTSIAATAPATTLGITGVPQPQTSIAATLATTFGVAGVPQPQTSIAATLATTLGVAGVPQPQTSIAATTLAQATTVPAPIASISVADPPSSDTAPQMSLLGGPLSGSQNSLPSAEVDDLEMGEVENDMEPIEINDQPQQQQSGGGLFSDGSSFGGLSLGGMGPSNTTANPFSSFPTSQTSSSGLFQTRASSSGSSPIKPASGSFSSSLNVMGQQQQQQQQPSVFSSGFGAAPLFGGSAFGSSGPSSGQPFNLSALGGRTFGSGSGLGGSFGSGSGLGGPSGGSFQQSGGEISFGGLAQQQSSGFSSSGFGGQSVPSMASSSFGGSSSFSGWRK